MRDGRHSQSCYAEKNGSVVQDGQDQEGAARGGDVHQDKQGAVERLEVASGAQGHRKGRVADCAWPEQRKASHCFNNQMEKGRRKGGREGERERRPGEF
jgi:hypothetical protein